MTTIVTTQPAPKPPLDPHRVREYIGYYRVGSFPPQSLVFDHKGALKAAKDRWFLHCERMGYKHICCKVHKVDLDHREEVRSQRDNDMNIDED